MIVKERERERAERTTKGSSCLKGQREQIHQYFTKHNIKSITLKDNKLVIKYNDREEEREPNSTELQQIKKYIKTYHSNQQLSLSDLQRNQQKNNDNKPTNWTPYILGGLVIIGVIGIVSYFLLRKKEDRK